MRVRAKSTLIMHGLMLIIFSFSMNLMASDPFNELSANHSNRQQWVCDYSRAHNDVLYLRCDDLAHVLNDSLIVEGENQESSTKYIPIWRRPDNESSAIKLVESVLCHQKIQCSVQLKSMFSPRLVVNR